MADAEALAARYGLPFTLQDRADAQAVIEQRRAQLETEHADKRTGVARFVTVFNRFYPKLLETLLALGDVLITSTHTVLIAFGVPIVLLLLLMVEQQRVSAGLFLVDPHETLAVFGAAVLVALNLISELVISYIEHRAHYVEPPQHQFSLRLWWARLAYVLGRTDHWIPMQKSPAVRWRMARKVVTIAILVLAVAGSMQTVIANIQGDWLAGIGAIMVHSTLLQMTTWIGGLLFAFAAVVSAQTLSSYVAVKVVEVAEVMQSGASNKAEQIAEIAGAMFLVGRLKEAQRQRRIGSAVSAASEPARNAVSGTVNLSSASTVPETPKRGIAPATQKALNWIAAHPESANLSLSQAAELSGLSESSIQRARKL